MKFVYYDELYVLCIKTEKEPTNRVILNDIQNYFMDLEDNAVLFDFDKATKEIKFFNTAYNQQYIEKTVKEAIENEEYETLYYLDLWNKETLLLAVKTDKI